MAADDPRNLPEGREPSAQDTQSLIGLLQTEISTSNHEVMLLTLELEQRVAERTAQLSKINQELMREIAERRRAEEEVTQLNQDLASRATLLQEANAELEAFSYSVSHDLRAPLRHIIGFTSLLEEESGTALGGNSREHLNKVKTAAKRMSDLIDELLDFSRLSHAQLRREHRDLNSIVDAIVVELEPDVRGRVIRWKRMQLPVALCDAALLKQVFANLISNALKYTRRRETTEIEIGFLQREPGELTYFVRDNGVGFDPRYADKLFGVFQRLHRNEEFEGTGVGLANVRRIISRHGGRTWAEGKPGEGATFYFSLPEENRMHKPN